MKPRAQARFKGLNFRLAVFAILEGREVKENQFWTEKFRVPTPVLGKVLINPRPYRLAVEQSKADLERAQAKLEIPSLDVQRGAPLVRTRA
jgi:hypothetical protein